MGEEWKTQTTYTNRRSAVRLGEARGSRPRNKHCRTESERILSRKILSSQLTQDMQCHLVPCKASGPNRSNHTVKGEKKDKMRNISKQDQVHYGLGSHLKMLTNSSQTSVIHYYFNFNFIFLWYNMQIRPRLCSRMLNFQLRVYFIIFLFSNWNQTWVIHGSMF